LNICLSQKHSKLTKQCFAFWRQKSSELWDLQEMAEEIRSRRDLDHLREGFLHWDERAQSLETLEMKATEYHESRLLRYCISGNADNTGISTELGELHSIG
jgi:hypothetical protein